jgi:hypothetical protein
VANESKIPPPQAPVSVQILDRVGEIVGVVVLGALAWHRVLSGELALVGIGAILGVQTGLRSALAGRLGGGGGNAPAVVGLIGLGLLHAEHAARTLLHLAVLAAVVASMGCGGASIADTAQVIDRTLQAIKATRNAVCTSRLDPLLGNPRAGEPVYVAMDAGLSVADAAVAE